MGPNVCSWLSTYERTAQIQMKISWIHWIQWQTEEQWAFQLPGDENVWCEWAAYQLSVSTEGRQNLQTAARLALSHVNKRARDDYKVFSNVTDRSSAGLSGRAEQIPQLLLMTGLKSQGSEAAWLPTSLDLSSEVSLGPAQTHSSQKRKEQVAIFFFLFYREIGCSHPPDVWIYGLVIPLWSNLAGTSAA